MLEFGQKFALSYARRWRAWLLVFENVHSASVGDEAKHADNF